MAEEEVPDGHCAQCGRRLSIRQAIVDWASVITVMAEVLKSFWV